MSAWPGDWQSRVHHARNSGSDTMTPQERRVYECYGRGLSFAQTCEEMRLAPGTVKCYLRMIKARMGFKSTNELVAHAARNLGE